MVDETFRKRLFQLLDARIDDLGPRNNPVAVCSPGPEYRHSLFQAREQGFERQAKTRSHAASKKQPYEDGNYESAGHADHPFDKRELTLKSSS